MLSQAQKAWWEIELCEEGIKKLKRGDRVSQREQTRAKQRCPGFMMPEIEFPRLVPGPGVWEAPWRLARAFSCLGEAERTRSVNKDGRKKPLRRKGTQGKRRLFSGQLFA
jgi:hypothetical protein